MVIVTGFVLEKLPLVGVTPLATTAYTKFPSPPAAEIVIFVLVPQAEIALAEAVIVNSGLIVMLFVSVQFLPSLTVMVCVPGVNPEKTLLAWKIPPLRLYW